MVAELSGPEEKRPAARARLVATGAVAVVPVLAALWEEIIPWGEGVEVLRRVSLDGFATERKRLAGLVDGVCSARRPRSVRGPARQRLWARLAEAARWMREPDWGQAPEFLPDPTDHRLLGHRPSWAPLFVPLLDEPLAAPGTEHRNDTAHVDYLVALGEHAVPMLRAVRRSPLRQRRVALSILARIGWCHLDARDRATMTRMLIRMAHHEPSPNPRWLSGEWYAVQTADRDALLAALDLSEPVVVPVTVGLRAVYGAGRTQAWVSPAIDGWTLVVGQPGITTAPTSDGAPEDVVVSQLARLSRRFGRAYHFRLVDEFEDPDGCNVWRLAERGEIVAEFRPTFADVATDRWTRLGIVDEAEFRTWLETEFVDECGSLPREPGESPLAWARRLAESEDHQDWTTLPTAIWAGPLSCQAVSVRVAGWFEPGSTVAGEGVLALTDYGRRFGHRGVLPLAEPANARV